MTLRGRNSDTRHGCYDSILFDRLSERFLERVQVHASRLLHDLTDSCLALLERLECFVLRAEFFLTHTDPTRSEIYLGHRELPLGVL